MDKAFPRYQLSADYLRQCLRYEDGKLFWLIRPLSHFKTIHDGKAWNTKYSGREAGYKHYQRGGDRWMVRVDGVKYFRHRIVWAIHHDEVPDILDHIDRNTLNDRITNLRSATASQNCVNRTIQTSNTSGFLGVSWSKASKKWRATIRVNGKYRYLGLYHNPEEASAAYIAAAKVHHGVFASNNTVRTQEPAHAKR